MGDIRIIETDANEACTNLAEIYALLESQEGYQQIIDKCIEGCMDSRTAEGVLVYLKMCEAVPTELITALKRAQSGFYPSTTNFISNQ